MDESKFRLFELPYDEFKKIKKQRISEIQFKKKKIYSIFFFYKTSFKTKKKKNIVVDTNVNCTVRY